MGQEKKYYNEQGEEYDPWELPELKVKEVKWSELSCLGKLHRVVWGWILRPIILIGLLYLFICSLDLLSSAFRLLGGKAAGEVLSAHAILQNPVAGLMIGVLVTVLVQSSSTSTSIVITMVAAEVLEAKLAVPIVMGANIGTTVTNTIVSMGQSGRKDEFRRAFGAATVHDMFNWLSVLVLLPIEAIWHPLFLMTKLMIESLHFDTEKGYKGKLLKALTQPFSKAIVQIDKKVIERLAKDGAVDEGAKILKNFCKYDKIKVNQTFVNATAGFNWTDEVEVIVHKYRCKALFSYFDISDAAAGAILLAVSLIILCLCLFGIVKILHTLLGGKMSVIIKKIINAEFPGKAAFLTGYVAILVGAGCTFVVQSSSIFTSVLTPLAGIGVVTLERMYPLTLGANIGTTTTGLLAALASTGSSKFELGLQIAFVHLFFNIFGIAIWYPIPFMRRVPIGMAKSLGNTTAEYRWFALFYLFLMFFILPGAAMGLSLAGWIYLVCIGGPLFLLFIVICIINILQGKIPDKMGKLKNWDFLPLPLRSLEPYDRIFKKLFGCCKCCRTLTSHGPADEETGVVASAKEPYISNPESMADISHVNGSIDPKQDPYNEADGVDNKAFTTRF